MLPFAALAFGLRAAGVHKSARNIAYVSFIGDLFLSMLKCIILPLIVSALISGLASMTGSSSGPIGLRSVVFYLTTVFIAVCVGIALVVSIQPGRFGTAPSSKEITDSSKKTPARVTMTADTVMDLIRNMFPPNIVQACVASVSTIWSLVSTGTNWQYHRKS